MSSKPETRKKWLVEHPGYMENWRETHREQIRQRQREWRAKHPEQIREQQREQCQKNREVYLAQRGERARKLKLTVITHYGNGRPACVICGFADIRALSIDHIGGGGNAHRYQLTGKPNMGIGSTIYRFLRNNDYPEGYRTLCMNCQFIEQSKLRAMKSPSPK